MEPLVRAFIATVVLAQAMHVYCEDFVLRPLSEMVDRPNDYLLEFFNDWRSKPFDYRKGPLELRCYAVLYHNKIATNMELRIAELYLGQKESLSFYVRPRAFLYGWRIQCDYRNRVASQKTRKEGIVLLSGHSDWRCLSKNGGCQIAFRNGEVRRISRFGGDEFIGELPETKCGYWGSNCKERPHPTFMFGTNCPATCSF